MTLIQKQSSNRFGIVFTALLFAVFFTSCGKDDDGGGTSANKVQWDPAVTVKPDSSGYAVLLVTGKSGTAWTAEITSGDWISFQVYSSANVVKTKTGVVGTSQKEREQFVYYSANSTRDERTAEITFTFEGQAPVVLKLVQYSVTNSDNIYDTGQAAVWPEIPEYKENSDYQYVTHYADLNGYNARNYTLCFDQSTFTACWVAYPLHSVYTGTGRPAKDPWAFDPKIAAKYQANLSLGGYKWGDGYDRGHQIPNADRNGNNEMQYQTFYCSNATPQVSSFNQGVWVTLENKARNDYMCPDTLYVVTGAYFANTNRTTTDKAGKVCPVPTNYFKIFLRTVKGNIRKKGDLLSDYPDSQLQSIGFWYENRTGYSKSPLQASQTMSVKEIEQKTGFKFFPQVSDGVKSQWNPSAWGIN